MGKFVGLAGPWKHQGTLERELSQQHPRVRHCDDEIPLKPHVRLFAGMTLAHALGW